MGHCLLELAGKQRAVRKYRYRIVLGHETDLILELFLFLGFAYKLLRSGLHEPGELPFFPLHMAVAEPVDFSDREQRKQPHQRPEPDCLVHVRQNLE